MARPNVPRFGDWEKKNEPYTVYFEQARKYKDGKAINPNDPQQFQDMFQNMFPSAVAAPATTPSKREEPLTRGAATRLMTKADASPRKSHNSSHGSTGRSRPKPSQSPEAAEVPRFGEWDDINPQNYTEIFNKVRKAKQQDSTNGPHRPSQPSYNAKKQEHPSQKCCFPWR
ncbi:unnamed protein product [Cuscuta epithymum]|uniref:RIN4 pathogenic type III effector avirulence factor Avr cleavage site domain-containing protein n=1 Tax=Cuscuta epithymum TaxID=186058 RepID=A0AAV0F1X4_9ASTE|nr:unnamed protein product [Cuscuta epithymum]